MSWSSRRCTCPPNGSCPDPRRRNRSRRSHRRRRHAPAAPSGRRHGALAARCRGLRARPRRRGGQRRGRARRPRARGARAHGAPALEHRPRRWISARPARGVRRFHHEMGLPVRGRHGAPPPADTAGGRTAVPGRVERPGQSWSRGRLRPGLRPPFRAHRQCRAPARPARRARPRGRVDVGGDPGVARRGRGRGPARLRALLRFRGLRLLLPRAAPPGSWSWWT